MRSCLLRLIVCFFLGSILVLSGCGGSSSSTGSSTQPQSSSNPAPSIASVTPTSLVAGSSTQNLTITGTGFIASTVINLNGAALVTTYVNSDSVTVTVPAAAIAADGTAKITATNPAPGGGTSAAQSYSITVPTPAATRLSPQTVPQGAAAAITVTGTGFEANSVATWNGSARKTTFVNSTTLQVALTAADVQNFGTGEISVENPGLAPSTPLDLEIFASTPKITSLTPNSIAVVTGLSVPQQVFIGGSGFAANTTVQANGQSVPVIAQSATSITVALPGSYFSTAGSINIVVSNPGPPVVSSNPAVLTVTAAATMAFTVSPNYAAAGSPDTTITLSGSGFYKDSAVSWNNTPLSTTYVSPSSVTAVIPAALLAGFAQASISVAAPEDAVQAQSQPFDTFLALPVNDIVYNSADGFIYASIPGSAGQNLGNSIVAIDPTTGVIRKTIFVGSQPNRLALSTDDTELFVGLDGAGAVRQVNLTTGTAGVQFSLGGAPDVYNPSNTAVGLAAVPGEPNSVAVYASNGGVTIYDAGVARANSSPNEFSPSIGGITFGSSASTLYVESYAAGYLYRLTVDATGVAAVVQFDEYGNSGNTLQYDNGFIYVPTGEVISASTGSQVGEFSIANSSTTPIAAAGPIVSDSTLNRAWILSTSNGSFGSLLSFDETTFNPIDSIPVTGIGSTVPASGTGYPADLIRWGQNGLAFHTANQLYVLQGPIVKDTSNSPADLAVTVQAPAAQTTGSTLTYTVNVGNLGPNTAQGVTLTSIVPQSVIFDGIQSSHGSCSGSGESYCDLGSIASGSSATVTVTVTPTTSGTLEATETVSSVSYDPVSSNNQATASTTVTGNLFSAPPVVTQLSPALIQAGTNTFTLTVDGSGFSSASAVLWNGQELSTTLVSSGQLTATVDASLIKQLGWSLVSVATATPGGGRSATLPFSIYQIVNAAANAITYDPFTRKLYASLLGASAGLSGNSIVAIDPATGSVGTPIAVGSVPNLLSETNDGNYLYIGLSGAKSLARFNLLTQALDLTVPLPTNAMFGSGDVAAMAIATVSGSDSSLAVEIDSADGIGIFDISGNTGTFRPGSSLANSGDYPVFVDPTHFYAIGATSGDANGAEFYRYSVDANGVMLIDSTALDGIFGGVPGSQIAVDGGLIYGSGGGIANPATTPPSQVAVLQLGPGPYGASVFGGGVVPYAAESKSFNVGVNTNGTGFNYLERFDTQHFTLEQQLPFPPTAESGFPGVRWGQDGLAYIVYPTTPGVESPQIFLIRGPFVLPAEAASNPAPSLSSTDHNTIAAGSGNAMVTVTGSGFLPGVTVFWNGSPRTTTYVDSEHVSVAIPASDVQSTGTGALSSQNPGSGVSNTIDIVVQ